MIFFILISLINLIPNKDKDDYDSLMKKLGVHSCKKPRHWLTGPFAFAEHWSASLAKQVPSQEGFG